MALFIIGAGATRGCSFVDHDSNPCLPPLDSDYFTQLQRISNPKHKKLIQDVLGDVIDLFGVNFQVTMENVFTTLEHTIRMIETTGDNRDFRLSELKKKRDRLLQSIAAIFEESLTQKKLSGGNTLDVKLCDLHKEFVVKVLIKKDQLISFNYDCVLDYSLKEYGNDKWNAKRGYGIQLGRGRNLFKGYEKWNPQKPSKETDTISLYKLHGSLHFYIEKKNQNGTEVVRLKERPYTKQFGNIRFKIIPPEWHKDYDKGFISNLWKTTAKAINRAESIIFWGYSLPTTDMHATALFRTSIKRESLKSLILINPDKEARKRIRIVVQRGINKNTKVLSFNTINEFIKLERSVWQ
jgi:hypothetical protein